ncbi:hypothetical protein B0J13DRAFT_526752 [Dactylonectria estremocensis]|uniref:Rhodopsin domain-containing protein n=1 Tax=Dactylonectria estremocensis TaxID=1079267 RepID=A0A9P9ENU1_9HYPO|nr:hypothetical protein B0J13DRAFT_526752 [Dactylonectria estremocensis]
MKDISPSNYLLVEWILVAVCLLVICARIAVRTWMRMWAFWLSDVLLIIAFLTFITLVIGDTWTFTRGHNDFNVFFTEGFNKLTRFLLRAVSNIRRNITQVFICDSSLQRLRLHDYGICRFVLVWVRFVYKLINWTLGVVAELLVFILPFGLLKRLRVTPRRDKIALACLFAIGFASILATVARLMFGIFAVSSLTTYVIGSIEIATQIVVVGLPALRPLLPMIPVGWKKLSKYCTPNKFQSSTEKESVQVSCSTEVSNQLKDGTLRRDASTDYPDMELHWLGEDGAHGSVSNV